MFSRRALLQGIIKIALVTPLASALPSEADAQTHPNRPPPRNRHETVQRPFAGHVWAPGYWRWNSSRGDFVWVHGRWIQSRRGSRWQEPHWRRHNGQWILVEGRWVR